MNKIREVRQEKGITLEQLAQVCGVTRQQISLIEQGKVNPSLKTAKKIGKALRTDWWKIFD